MLKRSIKMTFRMNKPEHQALQKKVKKDEKSYFCPACEFVDIAVCVK